MIKDRVDQASARWTLRESFRALLGLFAPFAPFLTEHLYQRFYQPHEGTVSLHLTAWPVADPGWVSDLVTLAAQTISRNKLIIGLATYGYEYNVTARGNGSYQYDRLWAFNPKYATDLAASFGVVPVRTSANEIGFVYNSNVSMAVGPGFANITPTQNANDVPTSTVVRNLSAQSAALQSFHYLTWSDAQAIADKVALAHALGVRGVAVFSLGGAEDQAMWSVLK